MATPTSQWTDGIGADRWIVREIVSLHRAHMAPSAMFQGERDEYRTVCAQEIARRMRQTLKDHLGDRAPFGGLGPEPRAIDVRAVIVCWSRLETDRAGPDQDIHRGTVD